MKQFFSEEVSKLTMRNPNIFFPVLNSEILVVLKYSNMTWSELHLESTTRTEKCKHDFRLIFQIGTLYIQDGRSFPLDVPSEEVLLSV